MFCRNCGEKLEDGDRFCIKCGTPIVQQHEIGNIIQEENNSNNQLNQLNAAVVNNKVIDNNMSEEDKKNANMLCIISLILTYGSGIFPIFSVLENPDSNNIFSILCSMGPLIGLVLMIIARIKYPNSKFAKVVMWIYIINIIIMMIGLLLLIITCYAAIQSCSGMG